MMLQVSLKFFNQPYSYTTPKCQKGVSSKTLHLNKQQLSVPKSDKNHSLESLGLHCCLFQSIFKRFDDVTHFDIVREH
jgi:hypothetical protein